MKMNLITLAVLIVGVVWVGMHLHPVDWNWVRVMGASVAGISLGLLVVARLQLGGSFSLRAKAKTLVTTGIYSRIRNPIYLFAGLFLLGLAVALRNWPLLLLVAALVPIQMARARREARVLGEAFGEEYARYREGTWF